MGTNYNFAANVSGLWQYLVGLKLPINLQTQLYYNVIRPNFGWDWSLSLQAQIVLPKSVFKPKK